VNHVQRNAFLLKQPAVQEVLSAYLQAVEAGQAPDEAATLVPPRPRQAVAPLSTVPYFGAYELLEKINRGSGAGQGRDSAFGGDPRPVRIAAAWVTPIAVREACQRSGRRSPICPAGVVGKRFSTSC
jgi:hypothetical protein